MHMHIHECAPRNIVIIYLQVCLISQSWDNVVSMHDHLLTVRLTKHRNVVHAQTGSCLGKIAH